MIELFSIDYKIKMASVEELIDYFCETKENFYPNLEKQVNIINYSQKIFNFAVTFEAWSDNRLVGMVAAYLNDTKNLLSFITSVSVAKKFQNRGIASTLMEVCINQATEKGFIKMNLEVHNTNKLAIQLYKNKGFVPVNKSSEIEFIEMSKVL